MQTETLMFATGVVGFATTAMLAATLFVIERPTPSLAHLRGMLRRVGS